MAAYIVATVTIHDPERFSTYSRSIAGLSERFGGEPLVRGPVSELLEGDAAAAGERVVVIRFPDAAAARGYIASPEYQSARRNRAGAADVVMRLLLD